MHRLTRRKLNRIGIVSTLVGCLILAAFGLKTLLGDGSDAESPSSSEAFTPYDTYIAPEVEDSPSSPTASASAPTASAHPGSKPLTDALSGPGKFGKGGDNTLHTVVMTATSDGGMYAGWRFRGGGEGVKVADRSLVVNRTVRGPLPVAQLGVQVLSTATYASCKVSVDGVVVSTKTVRGTNRVAVCVG